MNALGNVWFMFSLRKTPNECTITLIGVSNKPYLEADQEARARSEGLSYVLVDFMQDISLVKIHLTAWFRREQIPECDIPLIIRDIGRTMQKEILDEGINT